MRRTIAILGMLLSAVAVDPGRRPVRAEGADMPTASVPVPPETPPFDEQSMFRTDLTAKRGYGSAAILVGKVGIYHVFLDDAESHWTEARKQKIARRTQRALDKISQQAHRYGVTLEFQQQTAPDQKTSHRVAGDFSDDPAWTERVLRRTFGSSGPELVDRLRREWPVDQLVFFIHVDKPGLSYSLQFSPENDDGYQAERAVCFSSYPDKTPTAAATLSHETLHLFGAGDLYFPYDRSPLRKELAERLYPNDIMRRVEYDLEPLGVEALTAFAVGWREGPEPEWLLLLQ